MPVSGLRAERAGRWQRFDTPKTTTLQQGPLWNTLTRPLAPLHTPNPASCRPAHRDADVDGGVFKDVHVQGAVEESGQLDLGLDARLGKGQVEADLRRRGHAARKECKGWRAGKILAASAEELWGPWSTFVKVGHFDLATPHMTLRVYSPFADQQTESQG
jgi:hypothetical protein